MITFIPSAASPSRIAFNVWLRPKSECLDALAFIERLKIKYRGRLAEEKHLHELRGKYFASISLHWRGASGYERFLDARTDCNAQIQGDQIRRTFLGALDQVDQDRFNANLWRKRIKEWPISGE